MEKLIGYNEEFIKTYNLLKERNWPTDKFVENIKDVRIREVSYPEFNFRTRVNTHEGRNKLFQNYIIYPKGKRNLILYKELVRFASSKDFTYDFNSCKNIYEKDPSTYDVAGIMNIADATNQYLATVLFKDEKEPVAITYRMCFLITAMGLIINQIGIDKFVNMYFNRDISCLTDEIQNVIGPELTAALYQEAGKNLNEIDSEISNAELLNNILPKLKYDYKPVISDLCDMVKRSCIAEMGEEKFDEYFNSAHNNEENTPELIPSENKIRKLSLNGINPFKKKNNK